MAYPLTALARWELNRGNDARDVFARLAVGRDIRAAGLAVCLALGIPRDEAERRLDGLDLRSGWWRESDGTLEDVADIVGQFGLFAPHEPVGGQAVAAIEEALRELPRMASGLALGLHEALRRGQPQRALVAIVRAGRRTPGTRTPAFWAHLARAADLIGDDDGGEPRYPEVARLCRERAAVAD